MFSPRPGTQHPKNGSKKDPGFVQDPIFQDANPSTDILIAVMGQTGAGKSTFINTVLGEQKVAVSMSLQSCTEDVEAVAVPLGHGVYKNFPAWPKEKRLVLVDTPGFGDTSISDVEILTRVAEWLAASYSRNMKLAGIIYLHDINTRRMNGTAAKNLSVFEKLCGEHAFPSIVLGTTQWSSIMPQHMERADTCEADLRDSYWKPMIVGGSTIRRVDDNNPWVMISDIYPPLSKNELLLRIQEELVHLKKRISQTDAAQILRDYMEQGLAELRRGRGSLLSPEDAEQLEGQIKLLRVSWTRGIRDFLRL